MRTAASADLAGLASHVISGPGSLRWLQLLSIPRQSQDDDRPDPTRRQLFAALTGAHAELRTAAGTLAFAWFRSPGDTRMRFLAGGDPGFPPAATSSALVGAATFPVLYPPGATGASVDTEPLVHALESLPAWLRCTGEADVLWGPDQPSTELLPPARSTFDDYVAHLDGPFAWLVLAEPVPLADVDAERTALTARMPLLRQRENSEAHRIELERAQARYRELTRARSSGVWSVHLLVGAGDPGQAQRAAALLCSASDLDAVPYVLLPSSGTRSLVDTLASPIKDTDAESPFVAGTELLAAVARPPSRELSGIRAVAMPSFDLTPEVVSPAGRQVVLGEVIDESLRAVDLLRVSHDTLNRHAFICGATGSGKSQTARGLLEALSTGPDPIPWLVVEPAKAEYARMAARLGSAAQVLIIRPGDLSSPPASLNPLEPEPGFPLQSHADLVRALFLAAFEANEPFPQVLSQALTRCYRSAGWDLVSGEPSPSDKPKFLVGEAARAIRRRYPNLGELQSTARQVVDDIGYGREIAADVRGFVDVRIGSLRDGTPGRFFEGGHPLDIEQLLQRNVILELEPITNDQDKAFLIGAVLIRIVEHLRVRDRSAPTTGLRHVLLIEEAHRLLKNGAVGPAAAAVELFASLLAEIRAYGEGVVVVEQIPAKIVADVLKNTALKVMHRLPAKDDRDAVGATMNLDQAQSEAVVAFPAGMAAVTMDGADRPLLVRVRPGMEREVGGRCDDQPPLRGRRSPLCGVECRSRACDLGEVNGAREQADSPAVIVWAEAVAASLVIGLDPPLPQANVRSVWQVSDRSKDCALATVVDRAVDARRSLLRAWVDADDFAAQVRDSLAGQLSGGTGRPAEPARWKAGYFRYYGAWVALDEAVEKLGPEGAAVAPPHQLTADWRSRGLTLESRTLAGQLAEIRLHPALASSNKRVVIGDVDRSGLRMALIATAGTAHAASAHRAFEYSCAGPDLHLLISVVEPLLAVAAAS